METDKIVVVAYQWLGSTPANKRWWDAYQMEDTIRSAMNGGLQMLSPTQIGRLQWLANHAPKDDALAQHLKDRLSEYKYPGLPYGVEIEI